MDIQYRTAELTDLEEITALVRQAALEMSRLGIDQWDELYPIREDFEQDIRRTDDGGDFGRPGGSDLYDKRGVRSGI